MDTKFILSSVFTSFFTFQLLFHFVSYWFSAKISSGFHRLNLEKKIEWNSRVVSTCHSLVVGILGLYIFFFDEATLTDRLWGDSAIAKVNISIATGYLFSDLLILISYWKVIGDKYFILHHCTALFAYYLVLRYGLLLYVGNFRLLAELSSPFVNQRYYFLLLGTPSLASSVMSVFEKRRFKIMRWFYEVLGYPKLCKANVINGILMTVVFFLVRIAAMPPTYLFLYEVFGTEPFMRLGRVIQFSWISSCVVLDVMNVMWMIKISKGCIKVISLIRQENAKNRLQNGKLD